MSELIFSVDINCGTGSCDRGASCPFAKCLGVKVLSDPCKDDNTA